MRVTRSACSRAERTSTRFARTGLELQRPGEKFVARLEATDDGSALRDSRVRHRLGKELLARRSRADARRGREGRRDDHPAAERRRRRRAARAARRSAQGDRRWADRSEHLSHGARQGRAAQPVRPHGHRRARLFDDGTHEALRRRLRGGRRRGAREREHRPRSLAEVLVHRPDECRQRPHARSGRRDAVDGARPRADGRASSPRSPRSVASRARRSTPPKKRRSAKTFSRFRIRRRRASSPISCAAVRRSWICSSAR